MDPSTKALRTNTYKGLNMGGTSDWAVDLQDYMPDPTPQGWQDFKLRISLGLNPVHYKGNRTGNWTTIQCTDPAVAFYGDFTPDKRWEMLDCDHAWSDAVAVWKKIDKPSNNLSFSRSIFNTHHGPQEADCRDISTKSNCDTIQKCEVDEGSGACSYEIINSFVTIHQVRGGFPHPQVQRTAFSCRPVD